jgi:acetoin utilization protein AcuB
MMIRELISDSIPSVKPTDTVALALNWMNEFKVGQLPLVDNSRYQGLITEDALLDGADLESPLGHQHLAGSEGTYIFHENHIYDAIDMMTNFRLEVLPVVGDDQAYKGVITLRDVGRLLGNLFAVQEPGGVMVLSIPAHSYVLSEVGRIAESADAKVLSLYLSPLPDSKDMLLTLKLNVEDLSRVVAAFERFDYEIVRTFHRTKPLEDYSRNLEAFMKYLEI